MSIQAQSADGVMHEFPDGTDDAVIDKVMKSYAADNKPGGPALKADKVLGGDDHPRWDVLGDIGRAAATGAEATASDAAKAFPGAQELSEQAQQNRAKFGLLGGMAADTSQSVGRMGNALKLPLDVMSVVAAPVTGAAHATLGSALSYLPGITKENADRGVDTAMMGLGPEGGGSIAGVEGAAAKAATAQATRNALKPVNKAIDRVNQRASEDKITAQDVMDAQEAAQKSGDKLTLMDMGKNLQGMAGNVYRKGGEAGATITNFLTQRDKEAGPSLTRAIGSLAKGSTYQTLQGLIKGRSVAAAPKFEEAFAQNAPGAINSSRLTELTADPEIQAGLRRGLKLEKRDALAEGRPFKDGDYSITGWNEAGDPIMGKVPTMKALAVAKEGLDAHIAELKDPVTRRPTKEGVSLIKLRNAYLNELDKLNPKYKVAREAWSGPSSSMDALNDGKNHFSRADSNDQIKAEFDKLTDNEKEFYRMGAAEAKVDAVERTPRAGDESKAVANSVRDDKRFSMLFKSPEEAQTFLDSVDRQRQMFDTKTKVSGNAATAERLAEDQAERVQSAARNTLAAAAHAFMGNPIKFAISAVKARRDIGMIGDAQMRAEIAHILTDPSLEVKPGLKLLKSFPLPATQNYLARGAINVLSQPPYAVGPGAPGGSPPGQQQPPRQ